MNDHDASLDQKKHIIDPDKLSRVFGIPYIHPRIPDENDEYEEERYDTSAFIFELPSGYRFRFHHRFDEYSITIEESTKTPASEKFVITFNHITGVKYLYKYKTLVLDSRRLDSYSQLWINSDGVFRVSISLPIFYYHDEVWINSMGDGKQEETFRR